MNKIRKEKKKWGSCAILYTDNSIGERIYTRTERDTYMLCYHVCKLSIYIRGMNFHATVNSELFIHAKSYVEYFHVGVVYTR